MGGGGGGVGEHVSPSLLNRSHIEQESTVGISSWTQLCTKSVNETEKEYGTYI